MGIHEKMSEYVIVKRDFAILTIIIIALAIGYYFIQLKDGNGPMPQEQIPVGNFGAGNEPSIPQAPIAYTGGPAIILTVPNEATNG